MKKLETIIEEKKEALVRQSLLSDEFLDFIKENKMPIDTLMAYYRCAILEVKTKFEVLNEEFSLEYDQNPIENIKFRVKSLESLLIKIRDKNVPLSMKSIEENIQDIAGVRVVCSFQDDIYKLARCFLAQDDITLIESKDYIRQPKPSGYRSLHLIIKVPIFLSTGKRDVTVEVQLRTIAMDFWASLEHKLRYKKNIPEDMSKSLQNELLECSQMSAQLDNRMQNIRNTLAQDEYKEKHESHFPIFGLPGSK